jgi:hypothetical protein
MTTALGGAPMSFDAGWGIAIIPSAGTISHAVNFPGDIRIFTKG